MGDDTGWEGERLTAEVGIRHLKQIAVQGGPTGLGNLNAISVDVSCILGCKS